MDELDKELNNMKNCNSCRFFSVSDCNPDPVFYGGTCKIAYENFVISKKHTGYFDCCKRWEVRYNNV